MSPRNVRAVLFDWDGTLADTAEATYRCYVRMFADFDIPFDRETYARTYSPDWHFTYRSVALPEHRWSEADAKFHEYFEHEQTRLVEGAAEALQTLIERNVICGVVSSGTRSRVAREIANCGVDVHFAHIICGDDGHRRKPHPEALSAALERLGVSADEAAYVGDTAEDVMMARAAGVFCVAICGAYPNHDSLRAAEPDVIAHSLSEAMRHLLA